MKIFKTHSAQQTQALGEEISRKVKNGGIIALSGNLGSGKTTFVQGIAQGLGIKRRIISPTFTIIRSYKLKTQNLKRKTTSQNSKLNNFFHIDLYRIENARDLRELGINELIDTKNIVAIEWAEKMGSLLPKERIDIKFEYISDSERKITINRK